MADAYLAARIQHVREAGARLIRNLTARPYQAFSRLPADSILIAEEMTPADPEIMDPRPIAGIGTPIGAAAGHTAIMARSLRPDAGPGAPRPLRRGERRVGA